MGDACAITIPGCRSFYPQPLITYLGYVGKGHACCAKERVRDGWSPQSVKRHVSWRDWKASACLHDRNYSGFSKSSYTSDDVCR